MSQALSSPRARAVRQVTSAPDHFWNETDQLVGLFERYREADNNANAAPCFGRLARFQFEQLTSRPDYDPTRRSIVSAFQPNSDGTLLFNWLLELGYLEFWWLFTHRLCPAVCYASHEALEFFLRGGCACHTHAQPDPNILAALDSAGARKIWVHLRNPAETVCSSYDDCLTAGHGNGHMSEPRLCESFVAAPRERVAPGVSKSSFVTKHIGSHIEWVAGWLRFAMERPEMIVFSYHDELSNRNAMLTRVFDELGIELPASIDSESMSRGQLRGGSRNNWRADLTLHAQDYLETRIRAELTLFTAFDRLCS